MLAKKGMGQQQLSQEIGNLQKKNPADGARQHVKAPREIMLFIGKPTGRSNRKSTHIYAANTRPHKKR